MTWLHHVGITCRDIERSEKFYLDNFGLEKLWDKTISKDVSRKIFGIDSPARIIALKAENSMLELFDFPEAKLRPALGSVTHFALFVGDRPGALEGFKRKNIETILIEQPDGSLTYFIKDPDGILVELRD